MDNDMAKTEDPSYGLVGGGKLASGEKRSPLADALQMLDKSLSGLEMNIESLDIKLQPLQLRHDEAQRAENSTADRPPGSDFVNAIIEIAHRVNRSAGKVRRISNDLEL